MKKRQLIYLPQIDPTTFLFFFSNGTSGRSYSLRDYSAPGSVRTTYAKHYPYNVDQILAMAEQSFDAPVHDTKDLKFWHREVEQLNRRHLSGRNASTPEPAADAPAAAPSVEFAPAPSSPSYPIFAPERLRTHPTKGAKSQDLERIFTSGRSEDWMTWNLVQLVSLLDPGDWWPGLLDLARHDNPDLDITHDPRDQPTLQPWLLVASPTSYEGRSRTRMASSGNPDWAARSGDPRPVEGESEIDLVLAMNGRLGFIEAKLSSDVSMQTTYDPQRNQIARNVDCLLEQAAGRSAFFWMLVADRDPSRAYVQLLDHYRSEPESLARELPHRAPEPVTAVARRMAIVLWRDVLSLVRNRHEAVWRELEARGTLS